MKVGDVKRIRNDQDYTCSEARNQLCIIERINNFDIHVRIARSNGTHYKQSVYEYHLDNLE